MSEAVSNPAAPILEIENLSISFFTRRGEIPAIKLPCGRTRFEPNAILAWVRSLAPTVASA